MTTRLLFVAHDKLYDAVQVLQYDYMISDIDKTKVYYGPSDIDFDMLDIFEIHDIDTKNFSVHQDVELINLTNHNEDFYQFGGWISQQMLKLLAIHYCEDDNILIQDCDTYLLKPHNFFPTNNVDSLVIKNETHHPDYYNFIEKILRITRQTQDCFVTEFMPISKVSWNNMINRIEKIHNQYWFDAIYNIYKSNYKKDDFMMFSEYELLGNWQLYDDNNFSVTPQIRYESKTWQDSIDESLYTSYCLKPFPRKYV